MSKLQLNATETGYVLTTAAGVSVGLSDEEILLLAQSSQLMRDHVLAKHSRGSTVSARSVTPVAAIVLNTDLHKTEIHLEITSQHGTKLGLSIPLDVARPLADRLPHRVAEIERSLATRQKQ